MGCEIFAMVVLAALGVFENCRQGQEREKNLERRRKGIKKHKNKTKKTKQHQQLTLQLLPCMDSGFQTLRIFCCSY